MPASRDEIADWLRFQARGCAALGSPFYGSLLESATADLEAGGPVWDVLGGMDGESKWSALALRLMAAVHRLVLLDDLPALAPRYPSVGGDGDAVAAWPLFRAALVDRGDEIARLVRRPCQTNEVGRSAALLGGFLEVAHRTHLPLRILEVGASAGLNLRWDRYRYESAAGAWGDEDSPVQFVNMFDVAPPMNRPAAVAERKGCDTNPLDSSSDEGALALRASIWADQLHRMSLLDGALEVARLMPVEIERLDAADFLERELARPAPEMATVVFHSVFMQYVEEGSRERIRNAIDRAGVFYLRMEPAYPVFEIRLDDELVGTSGAHGSHVRWNVDSTPQ
ncbi:MAG TPA: DUF2332 domain-containing protein [Candidatus Dormibacteraeota bacterium]|nr:DUF2332 domain-containing protein [Candidatus Dormibacteraeota bacterium]